MRRKKELDTALPAWSGQTGLRDWSDRSPVRIGDGRRTQTREGPVRVGVRRVVLGSTGHLEMPSNVAETKEEQQRWLQKLGFGEDDKK